MNWRAQLQSWSAEAQAMWAECCKAVRADRPTWSQEYVEFHSFRQVRDVLLYERSLKLEDIPGWNASGPSRTYEQVQALPRDRSQERLKEARAEADARRRFEEQQQAENEPDEPRRQYAGGRR